MASGEDRVLHEANSHKDPKIIALKMACGHEGVGVYWTLIEKLMLSDSNRIQFRDLAAIAWDEHIDRETLRAIIDQCIESRLFSADDDAFWSDGLIKRLNVFRQKREQSREAAKARWAHKMRPHSGRNAGAMRQQCAIEKENEYEKEKEKEKETEKGGRAKGGEPPALPDSLNSQAVQSAIGAWLTYRRERKQPFTQSSLKALFKAYDGRPVELCRDIEHSISQGWQGIYPPKTSGGGSARKLTNSERAIEVVREMAAREALKTA